MKALFPIRTGDLNYTINVKAPNTTGKWSVELGFSGMAENTWGISGCSGKIYDNTGYNIGSYIANQSTSISGSIFDERHSVYQDGVLLSNQSRHSRNDYDMVEIKSSYINGYTPDVNIQGRSVLNTNSKETHEFWSSPKDRIYFVTENANADSGFVNQLRSMGFTVNTGNQSGVGGGQSLDSFYSLIIFGSATSSGNYNGGFWNSLNTNMMSLNSHLVAENNLNWYGEFNKVSNVDQTGRNANTLYSTYPHADSDSYIWVEFPLEGWHKLFFNEDASFPGEDYYLSYGSDQYDSPKYVKWYSVNNIQVSNGTNFDDFVLDTYQVSPRLSSDGLQDDVTISFTDANDTQVKISNVIFGTGEPTDYYASNNPPSGSWHVLGKSAYNKVLPQQISYNTGFIYRDLDIKDHTVYGDNPFLIYTGNVEMSHGDNGQPIFHHENTGIILNVWHKGVGWTGNTPFSSPANYSFPRNNLVCFSVTPTGLDWQNGYDMWSTLTLTGQRIFVNSVAGFFV